MALRAVQQGKPVASDRYTVGAFLASWLVDYVKDAVRPRTFDSYAMNVNVHLVPGLGKIVLSKLSVLDVQRFLTAKHKGGLSARTVQYLRAILRTALEQALRGRLVSENVAKLVKPPKVERKEVHPMDKDAACAFLTAIEGDRFEGLYSVAVAVGLRQGEALGLAWADVDLDSATLTVRHTLQRVDGKLLLAEPKTATSRRRIALPAPTLAALKKHQALQKEDKLRAGQHWQNPLGLVFTDEFGAPLDRKCVSKRLLATLAKLGLPRMRFHDMRHAAASILLARGVHARVVMQTLGHSQISLTMNTYSHVPDELQREAANLMGEALSKR